MPSGNTNAPPFTPREDSPSLAQCPGCGCSISMGSSPGVCSFCSSSAFLSSPSSFFSVSPSPSSPDSSSPFFSSSPSPDYPYYPYYLYAPYPPYFSYSDTPASSPSAPWMPWELILCNDFGAVYQCGDQAFIVCHSSGTCESSEMEEHAPVATQEVPALEEEVNEERPLLCRDEWPCDFCGSECLCERMMFSSE